MGSSTSALSGTAVSARHSRFAPFLARAASAESLSGTAVFTAASFTAALPENWRPLGPAIFRTLAGSEAHDSGLATLSLETLDAALCRLERSSSGLALLDAEDASAQLVLGVLTGHVLTQGGPALEAGVHWQQVCPTLPLKLADSFLEVVLAGGDASAQPQPQPQTAQPLLEQWQLQLLTLALLPLGTDVQPVSLFSVRRHGLSFKTLLAATLAYEGPVLVLVQTREGSLLGFATPGGLRETTRLSQDGYWREKRAPEAAAAAAAAGGGGLRRRTSTSHLHGAGGGGGGEGEYALFQVQPELRLRRWRGFESARNFIRVQHEWGIGLGGQTDMPRMHISADLRTCVLTDSDATYEPGPLVAVCGPSDGRTELEIADVEVWGVGSSQDARDCERRRSDLAEIKEERKKVDKHRLLESDFDKEMFFEKTFGKAKEERP